MVRRLIEMVDSQPSKQLGFREHGSSRGSGPGIVESRAILTSVAGSPVEPVFRMTVILGRQAFCLVVGEIPRNPCSPNGMIVRMIGTCANTPSNKVPNRPSERADA